MQSKQAKQQRITVNTHHICACFILRRAITLCIGCSMVSIIGYGYPYWVDPSTRYKQPLNYYTYISTVAIESITSIFSWIAVYYHIRCMVKSSLHWTMIHTIWIPIVLHLINVSYFQHSFYITLFITWIVFQFILTYLLWKYKQLLKQVYDWDDDDEDREESDQIPTPKQTKTHRSIHSECRTLSVSTNISQAPTVIYHPQHPSLSLSQISMVPSVQIPIYPVSPIIIQHTSTPISIASDEYSPVRDDNSNRNDYSRVSDDNIQTTSYNKPNTKENLSVIISDHIDEIKSRESESGSEGLYHINQNVETHQTVITPMTNDEDIHQEDTLDRLRLIAAKPRTDIDDIKSRESESDSEGLYNNTSPIPHTTRAPIDRGDTLDECIAASKPLPEEFDDVIMDKEGDDFYAWMKQTLEECAPLNGEWIMFWNNFTNGGVTKDTLQELNGDKQGYHDEWIQLIPKMGPRIRFQKALEKKLHQTSFL